VIQVTVLDLETGDAEDKTLDNDWLLITAGNRYMAGVQTYKNGTAVITVKVDTTRATLDTAEGGNS
jgi:hypothetical protein